MPLGRQSRSQDGPPCLSARTCIQAGHATVEPKLLRKLEHGQRPRHQGGRSVGAGQEEDPRGSEQEFWKDRRRSVAECRLRLRNGLLWRHRPGLSGRPAIWYTRAVSEARTEATGAVGTGWDRGLGVW